MFIWVPTDKIFTTIIWYAVLHLYTFSMLWNIHDEFFFKKLQFFYNIFSLKPKGSFCHTESSNWDGERQISYVITYMWNLKQWYTWTHPQNKYRYRKQTYEYLEEKREVGDREDKLGDWNCHIHTIYKIDNE